MRLEDYMKFKDRLERAIERLDGLARGRESRFTVSIDDVLMVLGQDIRLSRFDEYLLSRAIESDLQLIAEKAASIGRRLLIDLLSAMKREINRSITEISDLMEANRI